MFLCSFHRIKIKFEAVNCIDFIAQILRTKIHLQTLKSNKEIWNLFAGYAYEDV